jgi:hypothetical protein
VEDFLKDYELMESSAGEAGYQQYAPHRQSMPIYSLDSRFEGPSEEVRYRAVLVRENWRFATIETRARDETSPKTIHAARHLSSSYPASEWCQHEMHPLVFMCFVHIRSGGLLMPQTGKFCPLPLS